MQKNIHFITSNPAKVKLAQQRFDPYKISVIQSSNSLTEIQSLDVNEVAQDKARQMIVAMDQPFIIEDSGLIIKALSNFPGALFKPIIDSIGPKKILKLLDENDSREITVISTLIFGNPHTEEIKIFTGSYSGTLSLSMQGENNRGWKVSPIFIPKGSSKTLAQMSETEWNLFLEDFKKDDHYEKFGEFYAG
jgi:XTP/dITP diphosphohydrolase